MEADNNVELSIPNVFGSEKIAMEHAASAAKRMGFSDDRIEDLKTAVSEACLNAIEHGNKYDTSTKVGISLKIEDLEAKLKVSVEDKGAGIRKEINEPNIDDKIAGKESTRGWGIFLIKRLMDDVKFETGPDGGEVVTMIIHLNKK